MIMFIVLPPESLVLLASFARVLKRAQLKTLSSLYLDYVATSRMNAFVLLRSRAKCILLISSCQADWYGVLAKRSTCLAFHARSMCRLWLALILFNV